MPKANCDCKLGQGKYFLNTGIRISLADPTIPKENTMIKEINSILFVHFLFPFFFLVFNLVLV
jgi:hypothetical protein